MKRVFHKPSPQSIWLSCFLSLLICVSCGGGSSTSSGSTQPPSSPPPTPPPSSGGTFSTQFPLAESPISQNGAWVNGGTNANPWTNVNTTPGHAFGTMQGTASAPAQYADSTAVLSGTWNPDQSAQATVFVTSASSASSIFEEVELRLRTTISANSITGYEINCSVSTTNKYMQIVKWNGPLASFTQVTGANTNCVNGDVIKATISGSTISVTKNGTQVMTYTDGSPFTSGSPGIGFYLEGTTGTNQNYGFSSFSASD